VWEFDLYSAPARVAQSTGVHSLVEAKDFSSSICIQTNSEAHPASYSVDTVGSFPGVKHGRGVTLTTHPHVVLSSRMRVGAILSLPLVTAW
jgi:hypothetical protein